MINKELVELRKKIKKRKPVFLRQEVFKKKKLAKVWRRPKGIHSKMRHHYKGHRKCVEVGYGSPSEVKHIHPKGLFPVRVHNVKDLNLINPKEQGALIASVGLKNKIEIVKKAKEKGITVLNIKDIEMFLKESSEVVKKRQAKKAELQKKKEEPKKAKKDEEKKKEMTEEEKKEQEKKEKDKVLTKKEM